MHTTKKWLTALAVMSLAIAGGVVATAANATVVPDIYVGEDGLCYVHHDGVYEPGVHHDAIEAQHYSLKGNSGNGQAETPADPTVNPDIWQANTHQEPHYAGGATPADDGDGAYIDGESGLHFTSHGPVGEGLRDWFYFQPAVDAWDEDPILVEDPYEELVDCPTVGVPTQFSADPVPATCFAPGFFDESTLAGELIYDDGTVRGYQFENLEVWVYADVPGKVTIGVWAEGIYTLEGLSDAWDVDTDGRFATRTFDLEAQLTGEVLCPAGDPEPSPSPTPPTSPSPEPTPPGDDDAPPATPVEHDAEFTG